MPYFIAKMGCFCEVIFSSRHGVIPCTLQCSKVGRILFSPIVVCQGCFNTSKVVLPQRGQAVARWSTNRRWYNAPRGNAVPRLRRRSVRAGESVLYQHAGVPIIQSPRHWAGMSRRIFGGFCALTRFASTKIQKNSVQMASSQCFAVTARI